VLTFSCGLLYEKVPAAGAADYRTDWLGVWLPGDRLPSLREQVVSSGMSFMTVSHAYQLLESQGRIIARPQSGYYVAPQPVKQRQPEPPAQVTRDEVR
jgi:DNA-binding transcriptional MocR family regulator